MVVADVEVETTATAPVPAISDPVMVRVAAPVYEIPLLIDDPITFPTMFVVFAVVDRIPTAEAPFTLPEMLMVGVDVMLIPAAGVVPDPPVIEPVIVSEVPEKLIPKFVLLLFIPPVILPTTVSDPAV